MRRAAAIFKKYGVHVLSHDQVVALVYQMLSAGSSELAAKLHASQKLKPFTHAADESKNSLTLYFSSVMPEITEVFMAGAKSLKDSGLPFGSCIYKVIDAVYIPDVSYLPCRVAVKTISPIVVSQCKNGKKEYILYPREEKHWLRALERNLSKRVSVFYGRGEQVEIEAITYGKAALVEYQSKRSRPGTSS